MFDVKTPKRTYYLAAESEEDMNKWVDCVCHVCGLKAYSQDDTTCKYNYNILCRYTTIVESKCVR